MTAYLEAVPGEDNLYDVRERRLFRTRHLGRLHIGIEHVRVDVKLRSGDAGGRADVDFSADIT